MPMCLRECRSSPFLVKGWEAYAARVRHEQGGLMKRRWDAMYNQCKPQGPGDANTSLLVGEQDGRSALACSPILEYGCHAGPCSLLLSPQCSEGEPTEGRSRLLSVPSLGKPRNHPKGDRRVASTRLPPFQRRHMRMADAGRARLVAEWISSNRRDFWRSDQKARLLGP
jgi:hypothetical protein